MRTLKKSLREIGALLVAITFYLPSLALIALIIGWLAFCHQNQAQWDRQEPQDRADFERTFPVPAYLGESATEQARNIRSLKVAGVLEAKAREILLAKQELARMLTHDDAGSAYSDQVARAALAQRGLDGLIAKFNRAVHLADRFDHKGLYEDIGEQLDLGYGMAWCFAVDRLQQKDLSSFPLSGDISGPPGCIE